MRMKIILSIAFLPIVALGLSSCNTMAGLGKDVQNAGDSIEKKASNDSTPQATAPSTAPTALPTTSSTPPE